jgi:hypothetical protein
MAPLVAFGGFLYTIILVSAGILNWSFFLLLFVFVYSFAISLSTWAVLFEEITFHKYEKKRDVLRLIGTAFLEPFYYPVHTYFAVVGNIQALLRKKGWGSAVRKGFNNNTKKVKHSQSSDPAPTKHTQESNSVRY